MKLIKAEKIEKSKTELQFSVDKATFDEAVNKAYLKDGKKMSIPGIGSAEPSSQRPRCWNHCIPKTQPENLG